MSIIVRTAVFLCGCVCLVAGTISITGNLDPTDPNSVFLHPISLAQPGSIVVQSWGYGGGINAAGAAIPVGGFDPYLTLFAGTGPSATFLASDDDSGCPPGSGSPCGDPRLDLTGLPAGAYTLAVTTFGNMSFAENYGSGTLVDGFVGLGSYYDWQLAADRTPAFAIDITIPDLLIPEPMTGLVAGLVALVCACRARRL